jgi:hypothetical protein
MSQSCRTILADQRQMQAQLINLVPPREDFLSAWGHADCPMRKRPCSTIIAGLARNQGSIPDVTGKIMQMDDCATDR